MRKDYRVTEWLKTMVYGRGQMLREEDRDRV